MAIQIRRGNEADLDISRLLPGELAVCLDTGRMIVKLSGGNYLTLTELKTLNAYDITRGLLTKSSSALNGITFTWNGDVCTVSGTSTGYSVNILRYYAPIPEEVVPGEKLYIHYQTTDPNIMLRIIWRDVNNTDISTEYLTANAVISVPNTAAIWTIGLFIAPNKVIDNAEVSGIAVLNSPSNKDIGDSFMAGKGMLANGTDVNDVRNEGHYLLVGSANYAYSNSPLPSGYAGTLIVYQTYSGIICQMVVSLESDAKIYVRTSSAGTFSMPWKNIAGSSGGNNYITQHYENTYQITCTPTITTDTNQFLASTGDNTDRTGDIQAILNAGYTCRLGPGRFVVTGIEIPDYGTLEGCSNTTFLLLADSVSTGYAVKLKSYSTIKNVRISGATSAVTLSSTVGTRHGILFEGTKRSGSTAGTTFYRSRIHQCQITSFTGGGITCTGTGVDRQSHLIISDCEIAGCNAGIYIPYYSEFHRITNCVVQDCYYGCVNNGGNNNFTNCDFSGNRVGLLIDNSNNRSPNNSHGTFSACSINHSYSSAGVMNQGTAIKLLKSNLGEIFTGMQIFFGAIEIENCMGVRFIGANIGSKVPITVTGSTVISFSDCTFKDAPDSTDSPFTQSGNTAVKFTDCYLHNGTVYNPV